MTRARSSATAAMLQAARDEGVLVWVCLHHFTLPGWFADDRRGFLDQSGGLLTWLRHVEWVAETFGDLVHGWKPVNEPVIYAAGGFLTAVCRPGAETRRGLQYRSAGHPPCQHRGSTHPARRGTARRHRPHAQSPPSSPTRVSRRSPGRDPLTRRCGDRGPHPSCSSPSTCSASPTTPPTPSPATARSTRGRPISAWGRSVTCRGPRASREVLHRLAEEHPDRALLVSEVGIGTADEEERETYAPRCPGHHGGGHSRGHRPARSVLVDRGRQLRVAPRVRRRLRPVRSRSQPPPAAAVSRGHGTRLNDGPATEPPGGGAKAAACVAGERQQRSN